MDLHQLLDKEATTYSAIPYSATPAPGSAETP